MIKNNRQLKDLVSVGSAFIRDFEILGITEVEHLIDKDASELFDRLKQITGTRQDPCVEDGFRAAIAQAQDPDLPQEKCHWPYYSKLRKAGRL